jgi:dehydrogenase/reductase SDR family member 7B
LLNFVIHLINKRMKQDLIGKVVIITGASSGIGRSLALAYGRHKAQVVLAARRTDRLQEVASIVDASGGSALVVQTDVGVETDCRNLIKRAVDHFGGIDILINNAGVSMRALFHEADPEVIRQIMDINFWGTVHCTRYALPYLLKRKGSVVGVSSIAGFKGLPGRTGYSASKFAMHGFLESLRTENMKRELHVLLACPGFTGSEIREKAFTATGEQQGHSPRNEKRMMHPDKVALTILNAVKRRRRLLILTVQGKLIVALQRLIPTTLDRIVYRQMSREPNSPFR